MNIFLPCPRCRRHVRVHERICPFCAARAPAVAVGAAMIALGSAGCDWKKSSNDVDVYGPPPEIELDAGPHSNQVPVYGPPPGYGKEAGAPRAAPDAAVSTVYGPPSLPADGGRR
jgi:hypothetical protein